MSSTNDQILVKTSIDHSKDEISQVSIEQLEMRRLGLPTSFGTSKRRTKRAQRKQQSYDVEDDDVVYEHDESMNIGQEEEDDLDTGSDDDAVEEVPSIKLADDAFDFIDLDKLKISMENDAKRAHPDDETGSEISKDDIKPPRRKKKKSKKQKDTFPYWRQRFVLFSRFSEGIKLDRESWYSVTPEPIARHIACRIERALIKRNKSNPCENKFIILDGFCGAGGNTIQFALMSTTALVYSVDIDPKKIELARHNATIYGCVDKIQFIVADFFQVIKSDRLPLSLVDVCFLSPPWGGPDYNRFPTYSLNQMTPNGFDIVRLVSNFVTKNISFLLPRNFDMDELEPLSRIVYERTEQPTEIKAEIEENLLYKKVKTMTAYFGDLVNNDQNNNIDEEEKEEAN